MKKSERNVSVNMPSELKKELSAMAAEHGIGLSALLRHLIIKGKDTIQGKRLVRRVVVVEEDCK